MAANDDQVTVYGTDWCEVTGREVTAATCEHLDDLGVPYRYVNVDHDDAAAAWVREQNGGMELKPTLEVGGMILSAPRFFELDWVLQQHGLLPSRR